MTRMQNLECRQDDLHRNVSGQIKETGTHLGLWRAESIMHRMLSFMYESDIFCVELTDLERDRPNPEIWSGSGTGAEAEEF